MAIVIPTVGRSSSFRGRSRLAFSIPAEAGGTGTATGGTAIAGRAGGVTADPIDAKRDCFGIPRGKSFPALPWRLTALATTDLAI
jgi:hypothetical protein